MSLIENMPNLGALNAFKSLALMHIPGIETGKHIDVGHNKPLHLYISRQVASEFPNLKIVYYDNSSGQEDINNENIDTLKKGGLLSWFAGMYGSTPKKILKKKLILPKNLMITSRPKGKFDSATYIWTLHEFEDPMGSLKEAYDLLNPGARLGILDYAMGDLRNLPEGLRKKVFRKMFSSGNERTVLDREGLDTCIEAHTKYTASTLSDLIGSVGFVPLGELAQRVEYSRACGKDHVKFFMGFWKKE